MDDYIFLIIAIGLSIFGAINQSKKKKVLDNPSNKVSRPRNSFLDQLLGDDFLADPREAELVKPVELIKQVMKKEPMLNPLTEQKSGLYRTSFVSSLPERSKKPIQSGLIKPTVDAVETETEDEELPGYLEGFSLRNAFVYSEIMQRKY